MARRGAALFATLALGLLVLAAPHAARADIIYSNFQSSFSYNLNSGNNVGIQSNNDNDAQAEAFTPGQDYILTSIELVLSLGFGGDGNFHSSTSEPFTVALTSDSTTSGNDLPGRVLESFTIPAGTKLNQRGTDVVPPLTFISTPLLLTQGTRSWVTVSTASSADGVAWNTSLNPPQNVNNNGNLYSAYSTNGGADWNTPGNNDGVFEVDGIPSQGGGGPSLTSPEPGSWVLIASSVAPGLVVLRCSRSRRRRAAIRSCRG